MVEREVSKYPTAVLIRIHSGTIGGVLSEGIRHHSQTMMDAPRADGRLDVALCRNAAYSGF
jgi:hypothetical protein